MWVWRREKNKEIKNGKDDKKMRIHKRIVGSVCVATVIGTAIMQAPIGIMASSQSTIVCDDTTCWKVNISVPDRITVYTEQPQKIKPKADKSNGIKYKYKSSDTSVATVGTDGKIKGKKKGTATITTTVTGSHVQRKVSFSTKVTVEKSDLTLMVSSKSVAVGKSITIRAKKKGISKGVTWSVNHKSIATIGKKNGKLTGKKKGNVKVTAKCGTIKKSVTIKVK